MARIAGVDLPQNKQVEIGLTYIYGIGRSRARSLLSVADVEVTTKVKDLTEDEAQRIRKVIQDEGIYFVRRNPTALWYYAFDTQETVVLFQPTRPIPRKDPALAVSPDGQWLLFGQVDRSESDLMLVENVR